MNVFAIRLTLSVLALVGAMLVAVQAGVVDGPDFTMDTSVEPIYLAESDDAWGVESACMSDKSITDHCDDADSTNEPEAAPEAAPEPEAASEDESDTEDDVDSESDDEESSDEELT